MPEETALAATTAPGDSGLAAFIGKSIDEICPFGFGDVGDDQNHCAHFVGHALRFTSGMGLSCDRLLPKAPDKKSPLYKQIGALVRVNDLYRNISGKAELVVGNDTVKAPKSGLIFVSLSSNFRFGIEELGDHPKKHVGVLAGDAVFHYGNTADAVRKDTIAGFVKRMRSAYGGKVTFVTTNLPGLTKQ